MSLAKDDYEMVTNENIDDALSIENSSKRWTEFLNRIHTLEPNFLKLIHESAQHEITRLADKFSDLYSAYPSLAIELHNIVYKMICRGFIVSDAKWRTNLLSGINISDQESPTYIPKMEDFT